MRFKIDWANLTVRSKFAIFALFYFVFEGSFPSTSPRGAYIWRGDLTEGFLRHEFGGLIFGGAYTWRGLFSEFYGTSLSVDVCRSKTPLLKLPNIAYYCWTCRRISATNRGKSLVFAMG